jgi:hypothetical protein
MAWSWRIHRWLNPNCAGRICGSRVNPRAARERALQDPVGRCIGVDGPGLGRGRCSHRPRGAGADASRPANASGHAPSRHNESACLTLSSSVRAEIAQAPSAAERKSTGCCASIWKRRPSTHSSSIRSRRAARPTSSPGPAQSGPARSGASTPGYRAVEAADSGFTTSR